MLESWTKEIEDMWVARLEQMENEKQPFREFIIHMSNHEWKGGFKLAIQEIQRLREQLSVRSSRIKSR